MSWLHPLYLWALAAAPVAVGLYLWAAWQRRQALGRFGDRALVQRLASGVSPRRRRWKAALAVAGVLLLALALAGPRLGTKLRELKREGVDLVVALDVSNSMLAEDVSPSRLARSKHEVSKLLRELSGDRVGLVLFAGEAFIQCPLTMDYSAVRLFLDIAEPSLIPTQGTNFEAALDMALQMFETDGEAEPDAPDRDRSRVLLVISDGEANAGEMAQALARAREARLTIFTVGVGGTEGAPIPEGNGGYKRGDDGRVVLTRLEEEGLRTLATDDAYLRLSRSASLTEIRDRLDRLDKSSFAADVFEEYEEQFQWPLALALLLLAAERLLRETRRERKAEAA